MYSFGNGLLRKFNRNVKINKLFDIPNSFLLTPFFIAISFVRYFRIFFFFFTFILGIFHGYNPIFNFRCVSKPRNNYSKIWSKYFYFFLFFCFALLPQTKVFRVLIRTLLSRHLQFHI